MNKTNKKVVIGAVVVFLSALLLMIMGTNLEVTSLSAVITRLKKTERAGGATADGIVGGGTYYYAYIECDDKTENIIKFDIPEQFYNKYKADSPVEIKVTQTLGDKIFASAEKKRNPENYRYFIDNTEIMYSYCMIDDENIDR